MTIDNLEQALRLNNAYLKTHISALVTSINTEIGTLNTNSNTLKTKINSIISDINTLSTNTQNNIKDVSDDFTDKLNKLRNDLEDLSDSLDSLTNDFTDHKEDTVIHVTQDDKDLWNATLKNAKDYAKELFDKLHSFEIVKCQELPTEDINDHAVYFLQISPEEHDLFEEYMYINGEWELIGNTRIDLSDYVTKSMLQSTVDTLNQLITTKENLLNKNLIDLEEKHNQDIQSILDTISSINQSSTERNADIDEIIDDIYNTINELRHTLSNSVTSLISYIDNSIIAKEAELKQLIADLEEKHDQDIQGIENDLEDNYKPFLHSHDNKNVLDKLSENTEKHLLYNGEPVGDHFTEEDLNELISFLWRTENDYITADNKIFTTKDGYLFMARKGGSV